jgi:hypothetical protein
VNRVTCHVGESKTLFQKRPISSSRGHVDGCGHRHLACVPAVPVLVDRLRLKMKAEKERSERDEKARLHVGLSDENATVKPQRSDWLKSRRR